MEITMPDNTSDITLSQYMRYSKIIEDKDKFSDFELQRKLIHVFHLMLNQ